MDTKDFKNIICNKFGNNLENATLANVREFLDSMELNVLGPELKGRIVLEEKASSYEEIVKDFFVKVLEFPKDEALIMLWLLAFDLVFSAIELQQADKFKTMFGDFEE